jgi:hypothetical protein
MSWYTRGARPSRNIEAGVLASLEGLFDAVAKGKRRPLLHAMTRGLGAAIAMNEHRVVARSLAKERNDRVVDAATDILDRILDANEQRSNVRGHRFPGGTPKRER